MGSRFDPEEIKHRNKLAKIEAKGLRILRRQELINAKNAYKKPKKKIQTSKILTYMLMILLIVNCVWVERFSMIAMLRFGDLSALPSLIAAVVSTTLGEIVVYAVYSAKSYKETKAEKENELEHERLNQPLG